MSSSHKRRARPASDLQLQSSGAYKLNLPWNQLELWHKGLSPESHSAAVNLAVFEHLKHFEAGLPHTQKQSICRSTDVYGVFRRDVLEVWHVPPTWRFFAQGLWMRLAFGVTDDEEEQDQCVVEHRLDLFPNEPQDPAVNSRKWTAQNGLLIAMILLHAPYLNMEGVRFAPRQSSCCHYRFGSDTMLMCMTKSRLTESCQPTC